MRHILKCPTCKEYTMKEVHCREKTFQPQPARWSPEDKYGKYRLEARKKELEERGFL